MTEITTLNNPFAEDFARENQPISSFIRDICSRKLTKLTATAVVIGFFSLALFPIFQPTQSVWAGVQKAFETFSTLIVTVRPIGQIIPEIKPDDYGKIFAHSDGHVAIVNTFGGSVNRSWMNGKKITSYLPEENKVIIAELEMEEGVPAYVQAFASYQIMAKGYEEEHDLGLVEMEGEMYRLIEMRNGVIGKEGSKQAYYLDPDTLLPRFMIVYIKINGKAEMQPGMKAEFQFDVPIDESVFTPDYPEDATVENMGKVAVPSEKQQPSVLPSPEKDISRRGEKFIAVRQVWQHPSGWIAFRIETNLAKPFMFFSNLPTMYAYSKDEDNLRKWGFERHEWVTLHRYIWQGSITSDQDMRYQMQPRARRELLHFDKENGVKTQWRICYPDDGFFNGQYVESLTYKALANIRKYDPDQSPTEYMEWENDPDKFQMFSVTFDVPPPSEKSPYEIETRFQSLIEKIEREMHLHRTPLLEDQESIETALAQFRSWPKKERMRESLGWLKCLADHGRIEEAREFLKEYSSWIEEEDPDGTKQYREVLIPQAEDYFQRLFKEEL